jgi:hypothetical protein
MNHFKKKLLTHVLLITSILLLSCGAKHHLRDDLVYKADNFTYNSLKGSGMIIAGISSEIVDFSREDRLEYSTIISNILVEKLEDAHTINIINTRQLIDKLGKPKYFEIMEKFDYQRTIDRENIQLIQNALPSINFMLVSYIVNENIIDESYDEYIETEGEEKLETEYERSYFLTIDFQIYDIIQEEMVWHNVVYNEAERSETRTTRTGCVESCLDDIVQTILFGSPAEIGREEVVAKTIEKFAKNLARTKS